MSFAPIVTRNFPRESVIQIDGINGTVASCGEQVSRLPDKVATFEKALSSKSFERYSVA
jgi:hypothetical protein